MAIQIITKQELYDMRNPKAKAIKAPSEREKLMSILSDKGIDFKKNASTAKLKILAGEINE